MNEFEKQFIDDVSNTDTEALLDMLSNGEAFYSNNEIRIIETELKHRNVKAEVIDNCNSNKAKLVFDDLDIPLQEEWEEIGDIEENLFSLNDIIGLKETPLFKLHGNRGRCLTVYKDKCIIKTDVTIGSLLTHNSTDGEKLIYFKDVLGVQYKPPGLTIGYLQLETASMTMNNSASNFFNENTFTYDIRCEKEIEKVLQYILERLDSVKSSDK